MLKNKTPQVASKITVNLHNSQEIIESVIAELSRTEAVGEITSISGVYCKRIDIRTEIDVNGQAEEVEMKMAFPQAVPYQLPDFFFFDTKYDPLPHLGFDDRKMCLFESGVVHHVNDYVQLSIQCFHKAKQLLTLGANKKNYEDFKKEIDSYWRYSYNGETHVQSNWLFVGVLPCQTTPIKIWQINKWNDDKERLKIVFTESEEGSAFIRYIEKHYSVREYEGLFVCSYSVPNQPPYDLCFKEFVDCVTNDDDKASIKRFVNKQIGGCILFPLGGVGAFGGVVLAGVKTNRNGWRAGSRTAYDVLTRFEQKNVKTARIMGKVYSDQRIAERTKGELMEHTAVGIAGLGSIGSNLCQFLAGHNNMSFTLMDPDVLTIDNIGRHLLGFKYVGMNKAKAIAEHFMSVRPDYQIMTYENDIENVVLKKVRDLNSLNTLFICTGDYMSEKFVVDQLFNRTLNIPVFVLWLEPFAIAGHLLFYNPQDLDGMSGLFDEDGFYVNNIISKEEFVNDSERFVKRVAGCNGSYALYSGNDVLLFLSAIYPYIVSLISNPCKSTCLRWLGNVQIIKEQNITTNTFTQNSGTVVQLDSTKRTSS